MGEYHKYDLDDFLADEQFVNYVLRPEPDSVLFWEQWQKRHPEKAGLIQEAKFIIRHIHYKRANHDPEQFDTVLSNILENTYSTRHIGRRVGTVRYGWLKAAAVIAFFMVASAAWWFIAQENAAQPVKYVLKANPAGRRSSFVLTDGTRVRLNATSSISFPEQFSARERPVELRGEAFFEVSHDTARPFTVTIGHLTVTALGTSFNIKAFDDDSLINVALVTGKVLVRDVRAGNDKDSPSTILLPGQKVRVHKGAGGFLVSAFDQDRETGWKDGVIVFESADLPAFVKEVEKWYGVNVHLQGRPAEQWSFTGRFKDQSLQNLLEGMAYAKNFTFDIQGKDVQLEFKN